MKVLNAILVRKVFERLVLERLWTDDEPQVNSYQFTYTKNGNTSDAIVNLMHLILKHLQCLAVYARLLLLTIVLLLI